MINNGPHPSVLGFLFNNYTTEFAHQQRFVSNLTFSFSGNEVQVIKPEGVSKTQLFLAEINILAWEADPEPSK